MRRCSLVTVCLAYTKSWVQSPLTTPTLKTKHDCEIILWSGSSDLPSTCPCVSSSLVDTFWASHFRCNPCTEKSKSRVMGTHAPPHSWHRPHFGAPPSRESTASIWVTTLKAVHLIKGELKTEILVSKNHVIFTSLPACLFKQVGEIPALRRQRQLGLLSLRPSWSTESQDSQSYIIETLPHTHKDEWMVVSRETQAGALLFTQ